MWRDVIDPPLSFMSYLVHLLSDGIFQSPIHSQPAGEHIHVSPCIALATGPSEIQLNGDDGTQFKGRRKYFLVFDFPRTRGGGRRRAPNSIPPLLHRWHFAVFLVFLTTNRCFPTHRKAKRGAPEPKKERPGQDSNLQPTDCPTAGCNPT